MWYSLTRSLILGYKQLLLFPQLIVQTELGQQVHKTQITHTNKRPSKIKDNAMQPNDYKPGFRPC